MNKFFFKKTNVVKGTSTLYNNKRLKGTRKYIIKSFIFYYNQTSLLRYRVYNDIIYIIIYTP